MPHAWLARELGHPTSLCGRAQDSALWEPTWPNKASCLACHAAIRRLVAAHQGAVLILPPVWPSSTPSEISLRVHQEHP